MTAIPPKDNPRLEDLRILENRRINDYYFVLKLHSERGLPAIQPGQFVNVLVEDTPSVFLRRPISVYDVDTEQQTLDLLILIAGDGTRHLSRLQAGQTVNLNYPLGRGFSLPARQEGRVLLAGGGVGLAPLMYYGRLLKKAGYSVETVIGGRTTENIIEKERFEMLGPVHITTDDGSLGTPGLITQHAVMQELDRFDRVAVCGPDPMMRAVARLAKKAGISCEVSLENLMACGIGACLCCIEPTTTGNRCVCTDGPVFNTNELQWD